MGWLLKQIVRYLIHLQTSKKAAATFLEGDDGSSYNGGQRGYPKKPSQQFPLSLEAKLPKTAQLLFASAPPSAQLEIAAIPPGR